jgi:2-phosphosulfolactate phosphatase
VELPGWVQQHDGQVRLEWGSQGVEAIAAEYVVVVDVLRFTTAVESAVSRGAHVYPYRWRDDSAAQFAKEVGAVLADGRDPTGLSLSAVRLRSLAEGERVVLPSPNGSTCAVVAAERGATVVAACLRNARAVGEWLSDTAKSVAVIACGERWPDGSLRPSIEDYLGAAAVVAALTGVRSAEAEVAAMAWRAAASRAGELVRSSASGRELLARGWSDDLDYACEVDASTAVPVLVDGAFGAH